MGNDGSCVKPKIHYYVPWTFDASRNAVVKYRTHRLESIRGKVRLHLIATLGRSGVRRMEYRLVQSQ
jgi:hypothetical protein